MDWIIILGAIATTATVFSQVTAGVKNIVDTYYKVKEENKRVALTKETTQNKHTGEGNLSCI